MKTLIKITQTKNIINHRIIISNKVTRYLMIVNNEVIKLTIMFLQYKILIAKVNLIETHQISLL
jgi:hypothetical protein